MRAPAGTVVGEFWRNTGGQVDLGVETVLLALVYLSLGLRLWSRRIQRAQLQLCDWLVCLATVLMTARYAVEMTIILKCGLGLHMDEVIAIGGAGLIVLFTKLLYVLDLLWVTTVATVKLSILHFYSVIFRQRVFLRFVYAAMVICVGFYIGAFFGTALFCTPPQKKWHAETPGHCGDNVMLYLSIVITDLITDLIIIILPMPILWGLQLPIGRKIALTFIFGIGFGIVAITSVRLKFFLALNTQDATYSLWQAGVLSAIVPLLGLVNASLPVMQPALKKIFGSIALLTSVHKPSAGASSGSRSAGVGAGTHNFERLPESGIELSEIHRTPDDDDDSLERGRIRVTTDWEVNSTKPTS